MICPEWYNEMARQPNCLWFRNCFATHTFTALLTKALVSFPISSNECILFSLSCVVQWNLQGWSIFQFVKRYWSDERRQIYIIKMPCVFCRWLFRAKIRNNIRISHVDVIVVLIPWKDPCSSLVISWPQSWQDRSNFTVLM